MWVVRVGDDLYVRSAYGSENPWFRRATTSGTGRIRAGGTERDVTFSEADPNVQTTIDTAYHEIVTTVAGPEAHAVTVELVPTGD